MADGLTNAIVGEMSVLPSVKGGRVAPRGEYLSRGEQQMLTIARALMSNPEFLLLSLVSVSPSSECAVCRAKPIFLSLALV